ncbi:MAG: N-6 DNA methylase, partial [Lentisphaeria bacterium]|nr:N-6 DNA methylase [Lentisphaeria bacterium]
MSDISNRIVQKLWSYCQVLRDDGLSYQDYLEQLTFLLFLKMADERARLTGVPQPIPEGYRWGDLANPQMEGIRLEEHYRDTLRRLGEAGGMLGLIFRKAQNKIQDPAKLRQLVVELIGKEDWSSMAADVKGEAYEGLLEKNAQDVKGGAGQYFTPRPLIQAIVDCVQPRPGEVVMDPACGTGGFLLSSYDHMRQQPGAKDRTQQRKLREKSLSGTDI